MPARFFDASAGNSDRLNPRFRYRNCTETCTAHSARGGASRRSEPLNHSRKYSLSFWRGLLRAWQQGCAGGHAGRPRAGHRNRGLEKKMKKTLSALVAVAVLSLGVAFAEEAKTTTKTDAKTTTNVITGNTTEKASTTTETKAPTGKKTTKKKSTKKVTKKGGATKSDTTKTEASTVAAPAPTTR